MNKAKKELFVKKLESIHYSAYGEIVDQICAEQHETTCKQCAEKIEVMYPENSMAKTVSSACYSLIKSPI
jgi:hypothetical protein